MEKVKNIKRRKISLVIANALKCYRGMSVGDKFKAYVHFNDNEYAWDPA
jgi:hypothetical protein